MGYNLRIEVERQRRSAKLAPPSSCIFKARARCELKPWQCDSKNTPSYFDPDGGAFPFPSSGLCSSGKSNPTRRAVSRILSSSSRFIPGLYRSSSATYVRWARAYLAICSASWMRRERSSGEEGREKARGVEDSGDEVEGAEDSVFDVVEGLCSCERKSWRMRWWRGDGFEIGRRGSSRRRAR